MDMEGKPPARNDKTLGPETGELLLRLSSQGKTIFTIPDAQAITRKTYDATAKLLSRLAQKGWLVRLMGGKYLIVPLEAVLESIPMADRFVIAREVLGSAPYYISHYSAMELHEMTTQPVNTVYVTVRQQRESREIIGTRYRFVYAASKSFWGWENMWVNPQDRVRVSDLERTILDGVARPALCGGVGEVARGLWLRRDGIRDAMLVEYAQRLDSRAAARRVGYLLHTYGLGEPGTIAALKAFTNSGYDPLDPTLPDEGPHDSEWGLRINLDPEELRTSVWT